MMMMLGYSPEFALENGIPLSDNAIERTDDIGRYLYYCLLHKKCAICGKDGAVSYTHLGRGEIPIEPGDSWFSSK